MQAQSVIIEHLGAEDYAPRTDLRYVDVFKLYNIYEKKAFKANIVLTGPKGIAKSLSIQAYAGKIGCPIVTFDCSEDIRRSHMIGRFIMRGNETPLILGPLISFTSIRSVMLCVMIEW